jgi:hypothetical protein
VAQEHQANAAKLEAALEAAEQRADKAEKSSKKYKEAAKAAQQAAKAAAASSVATAAAASGADVEAAVADAVARERADTSGAIKKVMSSVYFAAAEQIDEEAEVRGSVVLATLMKAIKSEVCCNEYVNEKVMCVIDVYAI